MPRKITILPPKKKSSSLTRSAKSSLPVISLRSRMTFLQRSLPAGALSIFSSRRAGSGYTIPTHCPFCEEYPPAHIKSHQRRRWQAAHLAVVHVKQIREVA